MTEPTAASITLDDCMVVPRFLDRYPDVASENQLRWQIFNRDTNGLAESGAIMKRAGRWIVVVPRYKDWLLGGSNRAGVRT